MVELVDSNAKVFITARKSYTRRILIVNAYFDDRRINAPQPNKIPQAMAPIYLAGAFNQQNCEVRIYNEHEMGPLSDTSILSWGDMLILTGLTSAFDRMLHITAYAKTANPKVIVVAGGPAIRALPKYSKRFFDYICTGDIEQISDVIINTFGREYVAEQIIPRYDLAKKSPLVGYVESSRNCNYMCGFCSLTADRKKYESYTLQHIEDQIVSLGKKHHLCFIDNNFYGNDRRFFYEKMDLLKYLRKKGYFKGWSALVTSDFFLHEKALLLSREAGCELLFSGLETLNTQALRSYNKKQNLAIDQVSMINKCMDAGIVFSYGLMFDLSQKTVNEAEMELDYILRSPDFPLPGYAVITIPLLGTPFFFDSLQYGNFLPRVKVRDLDGFTLSLRPKDSLLDAAKFIRKLTNFKGYYHAIAQKCFLMAGRNWFRFNVSQQIAMLANAFLLIHPYSVNNPKGIFLHAPRRTFIATTDVLDHLYHPVLSVDARYTHYFSPTMITDDSGKLSEELSEDLGTAPSKVESNNQ